MTHAEDDEKRETYLSFIKDYQDIMNEELAMDEELPTVKELALDELTVLLEKLKETRDDELASDDKFKPMVNELTAMGD